MRLLLARHGQSTWNELKRFQGRSDVELSPRGRAQAEALGRALRRYRLAAAYVSPMRRAVETAEIALGTAGLALTPMDELQELSLGDWEGYTVDEIRSRDGNPYLAWLEAPLDCPPPGGEPLPDVSRRVGRAIDRIAAAHPDGARGHARGASGHARGDDVLVVAHGGVISVYACWLLGCSFNHLWRLRVDNASLTVAEPPRLVSLNDTAHLEGELAPAHLQRAERMARRARVAPAP
jgi:phosphoserine phosphatase